MLQTIRCRHCGADYLGGRCLYCGSDEFVDVEGHYNPENVTYYRSTDVYMLDASGRSVTARAR